jgi:type IV pilus assembly protein PilC
LSAALANHPTVFTDLQINLVKAGEASGNIAASLSHVAEYVEREHDIFIQIRQAMIYPFFVICVLFVVLGIIMVEVMPRISELVAQQQGEPPLFTRLTLNTYGFFSHYWLQLILVLLIIIAAVVYTMRTKEGQRQYDRIIISLPIVGDILKKVFVSRFCNTLGTLLAAGVSITNTLKIAAQTVGNGSYQTMILEVEQEVARGEKMSSVLARYQSYVPPFVVQMMKVGEDTGTLDAIAMEIVKFYQKEIKSTIDIFSTLLEPLLVIILGVVVATLAISVLSPLYGALGSI